MVKYNIDIILIYCCQIIPLCMQGIRHCLRMFNFSMIEMSTYCTFHFHKAELIYFTQIKSQPQGPVSCFFLVLGAFVYIDKGILEVRIPMFEKKITA